MKERLWPIFIALVAGGSLWWIISQQRGLVQPSSHSVGSEPELSDQMPATNGVSSRFIDSGEPATESVPAVLPGPVEHKPKPRALAAAEYEQAGPEVGEAGSGLTPLTVLENLRTVFRQFNLRFGANPVGDNSEITASLNGRNPQQTVFLNPDDGLRVNDSGELVDNWGTPFFFHQLSRVEMEIHSAGPDRKMWSPDDLVLK